MSVLNLAVPEIATVPLMHPNSSNLSEHGPGNCKGTLWYRDIDNGFLGYTEEGVRLCPSVVL